MEEEEIKGFLEVRENYLHNLYHVELQAALFGQETPPTIIVQIKNIKERIEAINQKLQEAGFSPDPEASHPLLDRASLRDILIRRFDETELRDLCFIMSIDYDSLSGNNKRDKARELILFCERKNRIQELEAAIRQEHPDLFNK